MDADESFETSEGLHNVSFTGSEIESDSILSENERSVTETTTEQRRRADDIDAVEFDTSRCSTSCSKSGSCKTCRHPCKRHCKCQKEERKKRQRPRAQSLPDNLEGVCAQDTNPTSPRNASPEKKRQARNDSYTHATRDGKDLSKLGQDFAKRLAVSPEKCRAATRDVTYQEPLSSQDDSLIVYKDRRPACTTLDELADCCDIDLQQEPFKRIPGEKLRKGKQSAKRIPSENRRGFRAMISLVDKVTERTTKILSRPIQESVLIAHARSILESVGKRRREAQAAAAARYQMPSEYKDRIIELLQESNYKAKPKDVLEALETEYCDCHDLFPFDFPERKQITSYVSRKKDG